MVEYVLKKIGVVSYVGDIQYELYKNEELNAIIYTNENDIKEVVKQLYNNKQLENNCVVFIENKESEEK